jgi:hypothetical protein
VVYHDQVEELREWDVDIPGGEWRDMSKSYLHSHIGGSPLQSKYPE